jgi:putative protease
MKNRPILTGGATKNDFQYPEKKLSYLGNVLNHQADAFYRRHGVTEIEPAAESGLNLIGRKVMTTRYCIKHQLGLCPLIETNVQHPEPLSLIDAEDHKMELRFNCARCEMEVYL